MAGNRLRRGEKASYQVEETGEQGRARGRKGEGAGEDQKERGRCAMEWSAIGGGSSTEGSGEAHQQTHFDVLEQDRQDRGLQAQGVNQNEWDNR